MAIINTTTLAFSIIPTSIKFVVSRLLLCIVHAKPEKYQEHFEDFTIVEQARNSLEMECENLKIFVCGP